MRLRESMQLRINPGQSSFILKILERLRAWLILGSVIKKSYLLHIQTLKCDFNIFNFVSTSVRSLHDLVCLLRIGITRKFHREIL